MKVAIVTPTIATPYLKLCVESVDNQTYKDIVHYLFVDGKEFFPKTRRLSSRNLKKFFLESNTGGGGWLGHRVYASCPFLVDADYICYLDEDNWIEPDHVKSLVDQINTGRDWAFSLRKIYNKDGDYLFEDNCESLGKWPVYNNNQCYHIDTSSYIVPTRVAIELGHAWYKKWDADRTFFAALRQRLPNFGCTGLHTLCYRLGGNSNSVQKEFFEVGNSIYSSKYDQFPWKRSY